MIIAFRVKLELFIVNKISRELDDVHHFGIGGKIEPCSVTGETELPESLQVRSLWPCTGAGRATYAAFSAEDPFDAQPLGLGIYLGVEPFHHLMRMEAAEVASFRCKCAPGVIQPNFMEQRQVPQQSVIVRRAEIIAEGDTNRISAPFG